MRILARFVLPLMVLCLTSFAVRAQSADAAEIDKFIASQAKKQNGEEPDDVRKVVTGDLNHDRVADTAVLYTIEGQNGTNNYVQYLAVFLSRKGRLVYAVHTPVGGKNRRSMELTSITENSILFDTTGYGKRDPSCCPTIKGRTRYVLVGNKLTETRRK